MNARTEPETYSLIAQGPLTECRYTFGERHADCPEPANAEATCNSVTQARLTKIAPRTSRYLVDGAKRADGDFVLR